MASDNEEGLKTPVIAKESGNDTTSQNSNDDMADNSDDTSSFRTIDKDTSSYQRSEYGDSFYEKTNAQRILAAITVQMDCLEDGIHRCNTVAEAQADLDELNCIKDKFDKLIEDNYDHKLFELRRAFAIKYRDLRGKYLEILSKNNKRPAEELNSPKLKLPALDIPKFNGDLTKWSSFKGIFVSLIKDSRIRDNDQAKRHFLFQSLQGEALSLVENLKDAEFEVAWKLLEEFYDDPYRRAKVHYDGLFKDQKRGQTLRNRLITYRQHTSGLRAAYRELNIEPFDQLIIASFLDDADTRPALRLAWERKISEKKVESNLENFFRFIESETTSSERAFSNTTKLPKVKQPAKQKGYAMLAPTAGQKSVKVCDRCGQDHYLNQCSTFRELSPAERRKFVNEKRLCPVCFRKSAVCQGARTRASACFLKKLFCAKCTKPHNTLLHDNGELHKLINDTNPIFNENTRSITKNTDENNRSITSNTNLKSKLNEVHISSTQNTTNLISDSTVAENSDLNVKTADVENSLCMFNENISLSTSSSCVKDSLLATVLIRVKNPDENNYFKVHAVLDNGSQFQFVSSRLVAKLNATITPTRSTVSGLGQSITTISKCCELIVQSCYTSFSLKLQCLVVNNIVNSMIPNQFFPVDSWNIPPNIHLADPCFNMPAEIDLLLGLDVFWKILGNRRIKLESKLPQLVDTKFGWIIAGSMQTNRSTEGTYVLFMHQNNDSLLELLRKFWELENCLDMTIPLTKDEIECEKLFKETTYRREDGRFVVSLPFKQPPTILGDSRSEALKRFSYLEKRLANNPEMREKYVVCMKEYVQLGHMKEIDDENSSIGPNYYLSHHAVLNPSSTSTTQRTVFNASMKTTSGLSLNDILYTGPIVQPELLAILMRFRLYTYVMTADIVKMFRQISIHPDHAQFQRVFWRENPNEILKVYELTTLSFGERPAPYIATRCLNELALEYGENYPLAKPSILNDFYVDNLLTGSNSLQSALAIQKQLIDLLNSAGFPLSKWCANTTKLLTNIDPSHVETKFQVSFDDKKFIKTLGMFWVPSEDVFKFWFNRANAAESRTKRQILSVIASIFDPMGLVGPVTVTAKLFMREIWKLTAEKSVHSSKNAREIEAVTENKKRVKLHWDDPVSDEFLTYWRNFASQLQELNRVSLPRHILLTTGQPRLELHGFADASSVAYGAVIYTRVVNGSEVRVSLLCSKSKVAPLKELSIARLELCAAGLLAELTHKVLTIFSNSIEISCVRLWSDSKVALSWIGSPSYKWSVFVAHRVSKIQSLLNKGQWDYVESENNPADLLSRGANPQDLVRNDDWFIGPKWLRESVSPWTTEVTFKVNPKEKEERKLDTLIHTLVSTPFRSDWFSLVGLPATGKFSVEMFTNQGYAKLVLLTSWVVRFMYHSQPYFPRALGRPRFYEVTRAQMILFKLAQSEYYADEIAALKEGKPIKKTSSLRSLSPRLNNDGVLYVHGRLDEAAISFEQRHPIILPPHHKLTTLIILHEHLANLHAGPKQLNSILRRKYWIVRSARTVRKVLNSCFTCKRFKAETQTEMMANLPKARVTPSKPFTHTGVDYAGPFQILAKGGRQKIFVKAYIAIFVCFATKAIHLELVSDLTQQTFIAALNRFISRRGIPQHIYSDNGTTFVGANNELKKLFELYGERIEKFAQEKGITWHFIPPQSPHFGGLWEAGVRSVKSHLRTVMHDRHLNFEEYATLLTQVEACLNSRPLTPESSDPNDLNALTPGHFLIGGPITALPNENLVETPDNRLSHWRKVQKMMQMFWRRWSQEYLNTLQQRYKWRELKNAVRVGDLVLLKENNLPPTQWKLGRISELHSGADGLNRVATVRTSSGVLKRPLVKLILLPNN